MHIYHLISVIFNNLTKGIFTSVLVLILAKALFKNKIDTRNAGVVIALIMITYAIFNTAATVCFLFASEGLRARATGPYWWAWWLMFIVGSIFPLLLFVKKLRENFYVLLAIAFLLDLPWIWQSFVIHLADSHRENTAHLPYTGELIIVLQGFLIGVVLVALGNLPGLYRQKRVGRKVE